MMLVLPLTPWKPDGIVCTSFYGHTQDAKGMPEWVRDVLRKANLWGTGLTLNASSARRGNSARNELASLNEFRAGCGNPNKNELPCLLIRCA